MDDTGFLDRARELREDRTEESYTSALKDLVQGRLETMTHAVNIERTPYFNHSAIPDFVVSWEGDRSPRSIYLRGSYAAIVAAHEVGRRREGDPIFLSLDEDQEFDLGGVHFDRGRIAQSVAGTNAKNVMLTDLVAFESATASIDRREDDYPLETLVRANYIRGGRGLFDDTQVRRLTTGSDLDGGVALLDQIEDSFSHRVQAQLRRAAILIDMSRSTEAEREPALTQVEGQLSRDEVRSLLPWLMRNARVAPDAHFWRQLGELIDLELLEQEAGSLQGVELKPLIDANIDSLSATRAYAGLNTDPDVGRTGEVWRMMGSTLTRLEGNDAVRFAHLGTRLRSTGSFAAPHWSRVRDRLTGFLLRGASVYGIDEGIRVDSRSGRSIGDYLNYAIPATVEAEFFVDDVTVKLESAGVNGADRNVTVDFPSRLVVASGPTSLSRLLTAVRLLDVLGTEAADGEASY